jgi:hypothetical protein
MFYLWHGRSVREPAIFSLPEEILDEIVSELDHHKDLVAFALASRTCANSVIPHHTQYRVLRVRHPLPSMWAHLARRSDLARNIRELHICERHNYSMPDHYPTIPIGDMHYQSWNYAEESNRIRNICQAIGHMCRLRVFSWSWNNIPHQIRPTSHPLHENAILTSVSQLPSLEALSLSGKFALHALNSAQDPSSLTYPLWRVANLRHLTLAGDTWAKIGNSKHLCVMLSGSPNLEYLEVPLEFHNLAECRLPNLRKLKLVMQSGANMAIDQSRALFLQNHPSIEELSWCPIGNPWIPPTALPNLKSLVTNRQFILAMDDPNYGSGSSVYTITSFPTPPATPSTPTAPSSTDSEDIEMSVPESPRILRQVEALNVTSLSPQTLLELKCLDRTSLRKLRLDTFGDMFGLHEVAEAFPNLEWLALPCVYLPSDSPHPIPVSKEQWLDILPRFKKLQVFRGTGLWSSVKDNLEEMHQLILQLAESCPTLRELDHRVLYEKYDAFKRIVISRQEDDVTYSVLRPQPRYPFDAMDGIFD